MDRQGAIWAASYAYLAYLLIGDLPFARPLWVFSTDVASLLFIVLYFVHSFFHMGVKKASVYFVIAAVISYFFELGSVLSGIWGRYEYTGTLGPSLGPIPVFIPFLWASLGYFCIIAAGRVAVSAVLMMLLDVSFDPRFATYLWHWTPPGIYFGVPLQNFLGWFVTSAVLFGAYRYASGGLPAPSLRALLFYYLFGAVNVATDFAYGLVAAGMVSLALFSLACGAVYLLYLRKDHGTVVPPWVD